MSKKVYVFLAEGFEETEAIVPIDILRRAGLHVITVSISQNKLVSGSHNISVMADTLFSNNNYADADLMLLPGGPGTKNLENHPLLCEIIKKHTLADKNIAAICAAPRILGNLGLLENRSATCYPGEEKALIGAQYIPAPVIQDGNIITGRGAGVAQEFALAIVRQLVSKDVAKEVANKMMMV